MKKILMALIMVVAVGKAYAGSAVEQLGLGDVNIQVPLPEAAQPAVTDADTQKDLALWNDYLSKAFGAVKTQVFSIFRDKSLSYTAGQVVDRINLEEILNIKLKTKLTFTTSSGDTVHVSAAKAMNCADGSEKCSDNDRSFILFYTDKGGTIFVKGTDIANFSVFMKNEQVRYFKGDPEPYTIKLTVRALAPRQSVLTVENRGEVVLSFTMDQLAKAHNAKAVKLNAGAHHNLFYNDEVLQDENGNGRFGPGRELSFSPLSSDPVQFVAAKLITSSGVTLPQVEKDYGYRIVNGFLEIYHL